jgi:hypothetical protein
VLLEVIVIVMVFCSGGRTGALVTVTVTVTVNVVHCRGSSRPLSAFRAGELHGMFSFSLFFVARRRVLTSTRFSLQFIIIVIVVIIIGPS